VRVDGKVHELDNAPRLARTQAHGRVVIDRLRVKAEFKQRLAESFETALRHADGKALF
jgi:excinuclease ABC subunit A